MYKLIHFQAHRDAFIQNTCCVCSKIDSAHVKFVEYTHRILHCCHVCNFWHTNNVLRVIRKYIIYFYTKFLNLGKKKYPLLITTKSAAKNNVLTSMLFCYTQKKNSRSTIENHFRTVNNWTGRWCGFYHTRPSVRHVVITSCGKLKCGVFVFSNGITFIWDLKIDKMALRLKRVDPHAHTNSKTVLYIVLFREQSRLTVVQMEL